MTGGVDAPAVDEVGRLRRRLERANAQNAILESMIEEKTRSLYVAHEALREAKRHVENVLGSIRAAVLIADDDGIVASVEGRTGELTGRTSAELVGLPLSEILMVPTDGLAATAPSFEAELLGPSGRRVPVLVSTSTLTILDRDEPATVYTATDISDRKRLEVELRQAHRLESIGALAAGVAHEINTPIQFVTDSVRFLTDLFDDLVDIHDRHLAIRDVARDTDAGRDLVAAVERLEDELDLPWAREELPRAVERTVDGLDRVATTVRALKHFAHPGEDRVDADVNQVVETALVLARNEYKYAAELHLDLQELPEIVVNPGDLAQVLVNLLVNAAHAIEEANAGTDGRGRITVATRPDRDGVRIDVTDTGTGIPAENRTKVLEPFFTTKGPGRGTGQGLALSSDAVARHGGKLWFESEVGTGTTFHIWLPGSDER